MLRAENGKYGTKWRLEDKKEGLVGACEGKRYADGGMLSAWKAFIPTAKPPALSASFAVPCRLLFKDGGTILSLPPLPPPFKDGSLPSLLRSPSPFAPLLPASFLRMAASSLPILHYYLAFSPLP